MQWRQLHSSVPKVALGRHIIDIMGHSPLYSETNVLLNKKESLLLSNQKSLKNIIMADTKKLIKDAEEKMSFAIQFLDEALARIRAGKANPHILDCVKVPVLR